MIYRSRYLDRLMFSPLGYRDRPDARPQPHSPSHSDASWVGAAIKQGGLGDRAPYLSSRELRDIVGRCEQAITAGRAQIEDYEAFIICQQELSSRA
jgi:hypothetical protein